MKIFELFIRWQNIQKFKYNIIFILVIIGYIFIIKAIFRQNSLYFKFFSL